MKKVWSSPKLEVLDIRMTMGGKTPFEPDCFAEGEGPDPDSPTGPPSKCYS